MVVGGEVHHRLSGSSQQATSVLLEEADRLIQQAVNGRLGRERLEQALREGRQQLPLFGQPLDLAPYFTQAAERTAPLALRALREALRLESADVDAVLLAGGGARFYRTAVESVFPHSQVLLPQQPVFANARGFWYYANPLVAA
jgi:plasmid segregation protein ParM